MTKARTYQNFVMVSKKLITDKALSPMAKFVYIHCKGKPNDWQFHTKQIASELDISLGAVKRAFVELKEYGLLVYSKEYGKNLVNHIYQFIEYEDLNNERSNIERSKNELYTNIDLTNNDLKLKEKSIKKKSKILTENSTQIKEPKPKILDKPKSDFLDLLFINFDLAHLEVTKQPFITLSYAKEKSNLAKIFNFLKSKNQKLNSSDWQNYIKSEFVNILKIALEDNWLKNNLNPSSIVTKINDINLKLSQTEYKTRKIEEPYVSVWS